MTTVNEQREMLMRIVLGKIDAALDRKRRARFKVEVETAPAPKAAAAPPPAPVPQPTPPPPPKKPTGTPAYALYPTENVGAWSRQYWGPT